jgi:O-antigen ligase
MILALAVTLCLGFAIVMLRWPSMPLAVYYNGTALYFYAMFKLGLQPTSTITGLVLTSLVCFPVASLLLAKPGSRSRWQAVDFWVLLFFLYLVLSAALLTNHNDWVVRKLGFAPSLAVLPYLAGRLVDSRKWFNDFIDWVIRITALLAVVFLAELGTDLSSQIRFALFSFGDLENPILVGTTFGLITTIMYVKLCESRKRFTVIRVLCIFITFFLTIRSGSRGGLTSTIAAILCYHAIQKVSLRRTVLVAVVCISLYTSWRLIPDSLRSFYLESTEQTDQNSVERRFVAWQIAQNSFRENPVFGRGFGVFTNQFDGGDQGAFAHNLFLELAAEDGAVGVLIFATILLMTGKRVYDNRHRFADPYRSAPALRLSVVLFMQAFVEAQFSGYITQQAALFLTLGLIWGLTEPNSERAGFKAVGMRLQQLPAEAAALTRA